MQEGDDGGLRLRGYGCPLGALAAAHPAACSLAEALVAELVGAPVVEECERGERPRCGFRVVAPSWSFGSGSARVQRPPRWPRNVRGESEPELETRRGRACRPGPCGIGTDYSAPAAWSVAAMPSRYGVASSPNASLTLLLSKR